VSNTLAAVAANRQNPGPDNDQVVRTHYASTVPECRDPTGLESVGLQCCDGHPGRLSGPE
jgi:hypothetical protein